MSVSHDIGREGALAVRAGAPCESEFVQPSRAVAERPRRDIGEQTLELVLAHHPVTAQDIQETTVEIDKRTAGVTATRPHDANAVARSGARQNEPPEGEMNKDIWIVGRARAIHNPHCEAMNSACRLANRDRPNGKPAPRGRREDLGQRWRRWG
jgi:hypothetical protein